MNATVVITIVGLVVVVILFLVLRKRHSLDVVQELMDKRKGASKIVSRAAFVQGLQRLPVAVALTNSQFFYENADLQAQLELSRIDEVEYDNELATGKEVEQARRVLRLRSHGQVFEFVMDRAEAERWAGLLPKHRLDEPGKVQVVNA